MMTSSPAPSLLFITGQSGAGLSTAMNYLEDAGYAAYDHFPLNLVPALLEQDEVKGQPVAIIIDTRARNFESARFLDLVATIKSQNLYRVQMLYLCADDAVLLRRFTETRRVHPLARDRGIADGIAAEKLVLATLRAQADHMIDTSEFSVHDLRRTIRAYAEATLQGLTSIKIMSFSYKYGLPREADLVFDVRFLKNPHWSPELRAKTGLDTEVQDFVRQDHGYSDFMLHIRALLDTLLSRYEEDGKAYLTIAFGCTGGQHRSVTIAEDLGQYLGTKNLPIEIQHREIG